MNESSDENSSEHIKNLLSKQKQNKNNIVYIPELSEIGKNNSSNILNGSKINNNEKTKNNSNGYLNYSENHFKSNDIQFNKKFNTIKTNNLNNQNISNGETIENDEHNKFKGNYDLIRKKLLLISKKEKKINKEKKNTYKIKAKSQTSKTLNKLLTYNNKDEKEKAKIKEYRNKIKEFEGRREKRSKTIYNKKVNLEQLTDWKNKFYKNIKKHEKSIDLFNTKYRTIKKRNTSNLKTEISTKTSNTNKERANFILPTLTISRPSDHEAHKYLKNYIDNSHKNLYKSINYKSKNYEKEKKKSLPKTMDFMNTFKFNKNSFNDFNNPNSLFSTFQRKNTFHRFNSTLKSNLISNTLLNTYKLVYDNNKKYLKKLKAKLKNELSHDFFEDWKNNKKKEISSSLAFIDNKISNWMFESPLKNKENDKNILFKGKYYKNKKDKKYFRIIVEDLIIKLSSPKCIGNYYFKYHKGNIEQNILEYLQETFFDFSLPSYIFEYKYNKLYLSKIPNKNLMRILLRKKTIDNKKKKFKHFDSKDNISPKKNRRLSSLELMRKTSNINNLIVPLSDSEKKSILYLYYMDIDLDTHENNNIENDDKDSFLKLLRGDSNEVETQDLLINKFISRYVKKNGTTSNSFPFNKKNSLKNNTLINKVSSESKKNNKMPLFRHNFFSRNEIKRSSSKIDSIKKKKSVLEYNLLFDPSLTGYNNLITDADADVIFEPNTERTIINRRKIKELQELKNKQLTSFLISSGGMKTDKNILVMKTLDLINQYNHKNRGNINSLTSSIKDCNYPSFVKFYRACNCGPNAKDKDGNSLLSLAVKSSCPEIVKFLLDEKANPNLQNVSLYNNINFFTI